MDTVGTVGTVGTVEALGTVGTVGIVDMGTVGTIVFSGNNKDSADLVGIPTRPQCSSLFSLHLQPATSSSRFKDQTCITYGDSGDWSPLNSIPIGRGRLRTPYICTHLI